MEGYARQRVAWGGADTTEVIVLHAARHDVQGRPITNRCWIRPAPQTLSPLIMPIQPETLPGKRVGAAGAERIR